MAVRMTTSEAHVRLNRQMCEALLGALTGVLLLGGKETGDLVTDLAVGKLDVVLGLTIIAHEGEETIVGNIELAPGQ